MEKHGDSNVVRPDGSVETLVQTARCSSTPLADLLRDSGGQGLKPCRPAKPEWEQVHGVLYYLHDPMD